VRWLSSLRIWRQPREPRRVLVIGSGARARNFYEQTQAQPEWGVEVVGFADDGPLPFDAGIDPALVHKLSNLRELLAERIVGEVVSFLPRSQVSQLAAVAEVCSREGIPLLVCADLFGSDLPHPRATSIGTIPALRFGPVDHPRWALAVKRGMDIAGAIVGLCFAAPLAAVAAVLIRLSSEGPVLYWQIRCGRSGELFWMPKLRTMVIEADELKASILHLNEMDGPVFKMRDDPRITPIGRFLRRCSFDELPQLWNVLRGEMSLVGPRPPLPIETSHYNALEHRRLAMKPGLTCLWQVSGPDRHGFAEWMRLDLEYIENWSLINDLKILIRTIPVVLRGENT
jgi:exopolysaccharide biosynthesis polyprenyl glycosylphosphotransferase